MLHSLFYLPCSFLILVSKDDDIQIFLRLFMQINSVMKEML